MNLSRNSHENCNGFGLDAMGCSAVRGSLMCKEKNEMNDYAITTSVKGSTDSVVRWLK
ncbi:helix-turn-helix domain-containing protein [Sesbania bispinosa]|nr:helix-turn-helix domain-containing protein [Sesbania bispinosa]